MNLMGLELCIYACVMCIHPEHKVHEHKYTHAVDSIYKRMKGSEIIYAAFTSIKMVKKDRPCLVYASPISQNSYLNSYNSHLITHNS